MARDDSEDIARARRKEVRRARRKEFERIAWTPDDHFAEEDSRRKYPFRVTVPDAPLAEQPRMFHESMLREPLTLPEDPARIPNPTCVTRRCDNYVGQRWESPERPRVNWCTAFQTIPDRIASGSDPHETVAPD